MRQLVQMQRPVEGEKWSKPRLPKVPGLFLCLEKWFSIYPKSPKGEQLNLLLLSRQGERPPQTIQVVVSFLRESPKPVSNTRNGHSLSHRSQHQARCRILGFSRTQAGHTFAISALRQLHRRAWCPSPRPSKRLLCLRVSYTNLGVKPKGDPRFFARLGPHPVLRRSHVAMNFKSWNSQKSG